MPVTDPDVPANGARERIARLGVSDSFYRFLRVLVRAINRFVWKAKVEGAEKFPLTGPVILAPVHRNFFDFFIVSEVTRRKIFYMTKQEMWDNKIVGAILDGVGAFPVDREGTDRLALDKAQSVLERGEVLIMFPEGTRRKGPIVTDLEEGAAFLAARTGASVVPIGIGGSSAISPPGKKLPRPVPVRMIVGDPISPPEKTQRGRVPRSQVHQMTLEIEKALQSLYTEAEESVPKRR